jgi:hypothetical protein
MPDLLAGSTVKGLDTPPSQADAEGSSYSFTSTTYTTATTAGTYVDCAVTFTAPTSGRVLICVNARVTNSTTQGTLIAAEVRIGSTVGSGTVVDAAADNNAVGSYTGTFERMGITHMLAGLTPGQVYNARLLHRVAAASTGSAANRELIVSPLT